MATRKKRAASRNRPFNPKIIGSNLAEARDELNELIKQVEDGVLDEGELNVGLLHAYHHLNFAWNVRRIATSRYASLTDKEFKEWGRYPADIETWLERQ